MAVEEPAFRTVLQEGDFEIRDYQPSVVAQVAVAGDQKAAANRGFRLLAGYIFGGNTRRRSIAMTAPVTQEPAGKTIAMTAPVTQIADAGRWIVQFTMPSAYTLDTLPEPTDPKVQLKALSARRVAVIRFSGLAGKDNVHAKADELAAKVEAHDLHPEGPISLAQYNPPWTPWFMRRNEVMISLAGTGR